MAAVGWVMLVVLVTPLLVLLGWQFVDMVREDIVLLWVVLGIVAWSLLLGLAVVLVSA
jgi:hypothetical protein